MRIWKKCCAMMLALCLMFAAGAALAEALEAVEEVTVPVLAEMKKFTIPENEAMALVRELRMGWNLGNTFDAFDGYTRHAKGTDMESSWVGVKTSEGVIDALKEAGFNAIRLPVSWHNHVDENDRIDADWLARVREVAGWALDRGLYVIVNVHHDNNERFFYPDSAHYERSAAYLTAIWRQMAEAFADCDDHLILESMNEPRLVDTAYEWSWDKNAPACQDAADCVNRLNQLFVDTVRASGGNNATRYLSIPAYDAAPWNAADEAFQLPKDSVDNRIIVAAHAYTPYNFALNLQSSDNTFDLDSEPAKKAEIAGFLNTLYERFVANGIPVIMDEFGAMEKDGNLQARVNFTAYYIAAASARGITCFWWDNHLFRGNGERFGILNRRTCEWVYPEIVEAMRTYSLYHRDE